MIDPEKMNEDDSLEFKHFRNVITARNASDVDRDISKVKDMGMFQVNLYDPDVRMTIIKSFHFKTEEAAEAAVSYAKKLNGEE